MSYILLHYGSLNEYHVNNPSDLKNNVEYDV